MAGVLRNADSEAVAESRERTVTTAPPCVSATPELSAGRSCNGWSSSDDCPEAHITGQAATSGSSGNPSHRPRIPGVRAVGEHDPRFRDSLVGSGSIPGAATLSPVPSRTTRPAEQSSSRSAGQRFVEVETVFTVRNGRHTSEDHAYWWAAFWGIRKAASRAGRRRRAVYRWAESRVKHLRIAELMRAHDRRVGA